MLHTLDRRDTCTVADVVAVELSNLCGLPKDEGDRLMQAAGPYLPWARLVGLLNVQISETCMRTPFVIPLKDPS